MVSLAPQAVHPTSQEGARPAEPGSWVIHTTGSFIPQERRCISEDTLPLILKFRPDHYIIHCVFDYVAHNVSLPLPLPCLLPTSLLCSSPPPPLHPSIAA